MTSETIRDQWFSYREEAIPGPQPHEVLEEARHAFYAGAIGAFAILTDPLQPDAAVRLRAELTDYCRRLEAEEIEQHVVKQLEDLLDEVVRRVPL